MTDTHASRTPKSNPMYKNNHMQESMKNLLGSFLVKGGYDSTDAYVREFELPKRREARRIVDTYNTLLGAMGWKLDIGEKEIALMDDSNRIVPPGESGVTLNYIDKERGTPYVKISILPKTYMRLSAAWGYNPLSKLSGEDKLIWPEIKKETPPYEPPAKTKGASATRPLSQR